VEFADLKKKKRGGFGNGAQNQSVELGFVF
jgi:hypothetical protein